MAKVGERAKKGERYVALLRGINVGGNNKLPMKDLAELCLEAGCAEATTFIQSGNVILRASSAVAKKLPDALTQGIAARFGFRIPIVMRTAAELKTVLEANPFVKTADPNHLHVAFLAETPAPSRVAALDPNRSPPDALAVVGRDVYLMLPNGVARTKITNAYLDAKLQTVSTARNWRTVQKLIELSSDESHR